MKYAIKLTSYNQEESAEASISRALQFPETLSHAGIIDIFSVQNGYLLKHRKGVFTSKKLAKIVAENINKRGAYGGFGMYAIIATVEAL